ncbi:DUF411 domain-containing protein [Klebsiella pneumoniae]|uniref:DUF411 domain-containing protein n=1 Tax=Klebsiella pneumoniae TaxID=573 RepID=UPI0035BA3CAD
MTLWFPLLIWWTPLCRMLQIMTRRFTLYAYDQALSALKEKHAIPAGLRSCHTAVAGNLIIEGHVPATTIHKAMQSGSGIYGLATPGMPAGSPGMEMGARKEAYDVIAFSPEGSKKVFQRIE